MEKRSSDIGEFVGEEQQVLGVTAAVQLGLQDGGRKSGGIGNENERVSEIQEFWEEENNTDQFEYDGGRQEDIVCVVIYGGDGNDATGTKSVSMDALLWTLSNVVVNGNASSSSSSPSLFLLHVHPPLRFIPTALGKLPISQANEEQRNIHLAKERTRRLECLQPFLDLCSTSHVNADVIPIEGGDHKEANAILELISALQIRRLVLGIHPSSSSSITTTHPKKHGGGISGVAKVLVNDAPQFCEVSIICQGKQLPIFTSTTASSTTTATSNTNNIIKRIKSINNSNDDNPNTTHTPQQQQPVQSSHPLGYCKCFKPKTIS